MGSTGDFSTPANLEKLVRLSLNWAQAVGIERYIPAKNAHQRTHGGKPMIGKYCEISTARARDEHRGYVLKSNGKSGDEK